MISQTPLVDEINAAEPVSVQGIPLALNVVLSPGEIPHKISPVHVAELVDKHEFNVVQKYKIFMGWKKL